MTHRHGVVVVGGSLAGVTAAEELRRRGYGAPVIIVGDELHSAYARPPLSKGVLKGTESAASIALPTPAEDVEVRTGVAAAGLDPRAQIVHLTDGSGLPYDHVVIATGSRARRFGSSPDEHVLRTIDDAVRLRAAFSEGGRVVVVGGGFLGMEAASAACAMGLEVTVLDVRTPLVPVLGEHLGGAVVAAAREHGVTVEVSPDGVALLTDGARVRGAVTADGRRFPAETLITAIGDLPNTDWLRNSGVRLSDDGWLVVDRWTRAEVDGARPGTVLGAGDVTVLPTVRGARRVPHWNNAIGQAGAAAEIILEGSGALYEPDPYFWTDAFGISMKIAGWLPATGPFEELAGSVDARSALLRWADGDRATVAAVNHRIPVSRLRRLATTATADLLAT